MKVGDLVVMKYRMFWDLKRNNSMKYTDEPLLLLECSPQHGAVKVMYPSGQVRAGIEEWYEVVSEQVQKVQ